MSYYLYFECDNMIFKSVRPFIEHKYNNEKYYQILRDVDFCMRIDDLDKEYKFKIASDDNILIDWSIFKYTDYNVDIESGELYKEINGYKMMYSYYILDNYRIITTPTLIATS